MDSGSSSVKSCRALSRHKPASVILTNPLIICKGHEEAPLLRSFNVSAKLNQLLGQPWYPVASI